MTEPLWVARIYKSMLCPMFFLGFTHFPGNCIKSLVPGNTFKAAFSTLSCSLHRIKQPFGMIEGLFEGCTLYTKLAAIRSRQTVTAFYLDYLPIFDIGIYKTVFAAKTTYSPPDSDAGFLSGYFSFKKLFGRIILHKFLSFPWGSIILLRYSFRSSKSTAACIIFENQIVRRSFIIFCKY